MGGSQMEGVEMDNGAKEIESIGLNGAKDLERVQHPPQREESA